MCHWTIGMEYPAMTAGIPFQVKTAISAKSAKTIFAANAAVIVKFVIRQSVWVAAMNVHLVINLFAGTVPQYVLNAKKPSVRIALAKTAYANTA